MHNNNRRDPRGNFTTGAAEGRRRWAWALAFITVLAGCQTLAPQSDGPQTTPQPPPEPPVAVTGTAAVATPMASELAAEASPEDRVIEALLATETSLEAIPDLGPDSSPAETEAEASELSEPRDLITRIRSELSLPIATDPAIQAELEWFASHPEYLDRVFLRSESFLHHIVETLDERGMPLDLALLPVVESAFDPFAYSHGRAAGLWQIIPGTGRRLGLKQNWWFDARRDVLESTRAALDYLERLHEMFDGDWLLAVAGYNSGEGNVARAIRRAEAAGEPTDFWGIKRYLPAETRTYVPRLLALKQLVAAPSHLGLSLPVLADEAFFEIIETGGQIDMALASELAGLSTEALYWLNPGVNRWATDPDGPHRLLIPVDRAEDFSAAVADLNGGERVRWSRHTVGQGETLSHLAITYQTTPAVLQEVNELGRNSMIRLGQELMIPHAVKNLREYTQTLDARNSRTQNKTREGQKQSHVVRAGESLWVISRRYEVGVRELASWNAMAPGDPLSIGRELVVWSDKAVMAPGQNQRIRRVTYTVRRGDSLSRISTRFRVSVPDLLNWNSLSSDKYLQPGQQVVVYVDVTEQST